MMKKERFALVDRTLSRTCGIALADRHNWARTARFRSSQTLRRSRLGVRRYTEILRVLATRCRGCAAFLLLSTICYQLSAICASAQPAPTWKPRGREPFEKYDNPPAAPRKIETSPRMISPHGPFISYQVNVDADGQNIVGDAANECSIAVDPTDPSRMAIGWRQFDDYHSNFRQAGWGYTTDGGLTWTFPGVLQNNVFRSDPVTQSDEVGNFFYLSLQSDVNLSFFCDDLWGSINGGQSWVEQSPDRGAGGGDKQWLTIDKTGGPGHGFQYQADDGINCSGGGVQFQRSTDGGV